MFDRSKFKQFWKVRFWIIMVVICLSNAHRLVQDDVMILIKLPLWLILLWLLEQLIKQHTQKSKL